MAKNVMVLAMSTLPLKEEKKENVDEKEKNSDIKTFKIEENKFAWEENDEGQPYYSQLEPASKMIREREGSLDKIIILATSATKKPKKFKYKGIEREISAVDFYLERMEITGTAFNPNIEIIDIDENDIVEGISQTVDSIRGYWLKNIKDEPKLWIDTQGGFRDISLMINAIISLLKDEIKPSGIYAIKFLGGNSVNRIEDKTNTYKIFDFVSGVNEFSRYGRAEQLEDYYRSVGDEEAIPEPVKIMGKIGDAIQMCDMEAFDDNLQKLRNLKSNEEKGLLGIFWNQIKNDYGRLLDDSWTGIDVVEWFYKKKLYQQALTYIEAKLPIEWVQKKKIIEYENEDEVSLDLIQEKLGKTYESYENTFINQVAFASFKWQSLTFKFKEELDQPPRKSDLNNLKIGRNENYKNPSEVKEVTSKVKKIKVTLKVKFDKNVNREKLWDMIFMYKLLKQERNNFNHMVMNSKNKVDLNTKSKIISWKTDQKTLSKAIELFIDLNKEVYKAIE